MSTQFPHLFTPIKIRNKTMKNRVVSSAHATRFDFFGDEHKPDQYIEYQRARARGGCGLIILSNCQIHASTSGTNVHPPTPEILAPKLKKMADILHEYGTTVTVQLHHRGNSQSSIENIHANWGFSAQPSPEPGAEVCHEMDEEEIEEILNAYVTYSRLAKECGLDGVELHAAHGFLIGQSWSNWGNQRTDKWGEQMAFANELVRRVRAAVGDDFLVDMRISSDDFRPGGMDNEAMKKIARALEATGKLDFLNISQGGKQSDFAWSIGTMYVPPGSLIPLTSGIKQAVKSIPILAASRINDPFLAENILVDGHADLVGMCRAQIADPDFVNKVREGRIDDIRLCIACNQGCQDRISQKMKATCLQNCRVGKEKSIGTIPPAQKKKKVVVVGGGPAGMEAARVAALRGHKVTLYEKEKQLGGQINTITKAPGREEFGQVTRYLATQLGKLQVNVKLGVEATPEMVKQEKPDAVVIATGAVPYIQSVPGSNQENVLSTTQVLNGATTGQRIVVFDTTGFQEAINVADFLADQGKQVEIITPYPTAGTQIGSSNQPLVWPRLLNKGITFTGFTTLKKISGHTVTVASVHNEKERAIHNVDTVVMATGYRATDGIWRALRSHKGQVRELYAVGDCYAPRRAMDAIHEAYNTAFKI